ncbi:MFS transporter [Mycetocola reblochoni]|uniref:Niacin transporter NiaP n=2 Tax=Mycetocola reblochoni TaxID=331618 RepID=A0A1R4IJ07_9MICO|nr:MFS transporter [Mycetocola reblochoni]SJN19738.1 Niacin transporter NiaP [Mycetocola reblochoni REB411]
MTTAPQTPTTAEQQAALLARLDDLEPGKPHRRLMVMGGLGYTFDSFDGQLMGYALSALIVIWAIPAEVSGWLLSSIFFGYLVGALVAGVLADRFGRKRLMLTSLLIFSLCSLLMGTATTVPELFIWRALAGIGIGAETALIAPYISEFLPAKARGTFVARTVGFLAFGYILAGVIAPIVISPNPEIGWRIAAVVAALPVVLLLWWRRRLPESPRFLLTRGRIDEATAVVEDFERRSGLDPAEHAAAVAARRASATGSEQQATAAADPAASPAGPGGDPSAAGAAGAAAPDGAEPGGQGRSKLLAPLAGLWRGRLARTTIVIWVLWFILTGVNYGFASWLPALLITAKGFTLTGSFLFALVTALAQLPGYYVASLLIDRMERKWLLAIYAAGGTVSAVIVALAGSPSVLLLGCALLAAFTNGAAAVYYTYTAELYPTAVRATGVGVASAVGRIGAISAPIAIGYLYASIGFANVFLCLVAALVLAVVVVVVFGERTSGRRLNEEVPSGS